MVRHEPISEADPVHFGEVFEGKEIEHSFTVKNTGGAPLRIKSVRPG